MKKILVYSLLLVTGLLGSQYVPALSAAAGIDLTAAIRLTTMLLLAFIMVGVGREFDIDKTRLRSYAVDYGVAATAAAFPWILSTAYFVFVMTDSSLWSDGETWVRSLLAGRFAAPTSAGVLFAMLAAAGLSATWVFRKARILAIFDDLDTVLLMIPLKILIVGWAWQLGVVVIVMALLLWIAWRWLHSVRLPVTDSWIFGYSLVITLVCEAIYRGSKAISDTVPIHIEVLLPSFVLGCILAHPQPGAHDHAHAGGSGLSGAVSLTFMLAVGLSMPPLQAAYGDGPIPWAALAWHVLALTILGNAGKMFSVFCYRREATWRERLAVGVAMWPRGEVGAGVLVVSLSYGIGGPIVAAAALSLALNLILTGLFIAIVKALIEPASSAVPFSR